MTQTEQVEQAIRIEIVFRALVNDMPKVAGIFAENRSTVEPSLIRIRWDARRFGNLGDAEKFGQSATRAMQKLGMPHNVSVEEVS